MPSPLSLYLAQEESIACNLLPNGITTPAARSMFFSSQNFDLKLIKWNKLSQVLFFFLSFKVSNIQTTILFYFIFGGMFSSLGHKKIHCNSYRGFFIFFVNPKKPPKSPDFTRKKF
jgi:hypothetical protein